MTKTTCSACDHIVRGNMQLCPMCGASMKSNIDNDERKCPRCRTALEIHDYRNFAIDKCNTCDGLWLEPDHFKVLSSEFDVYRDDESNPVYTKPPLPPAEPYLPCANCGQLMVRKNFQNISGVLIDLCMSCGVWLDKDELVQIRNFVASGGLDKAQDKQLGKQDIELERLNDRVSDLELMEKMLNKFDLKRILFRGF